MRYGNAKVHCGQPQQFFIVAVEAEDMPVVFFSLAVGGFKLFAMDFHSKRHICDLLPDNPEHTIPRNPGN